MVQSIELLLDEQSESALRSEWGRLRAAGLPSLASHTGGTNRPHVTVAVAEEGLEGAVDRVRAVFAGWGLGERGLAGMVGAPLLFGGHRNRWVLARQVVVSRPLLTMHSAVHRAIDLAGTAINLNPLTRPDDWTPHITVARRMGADQLPAALALLDVEPGPVRFVAARFWDSVPKTATPLD